MACLEWAGNEVLFVMISGVGDDPALNPGRDPTQKKGKQDSHYHVDHTVLLQKHGGADNGDTEQDPCGPHPP